MITLGLSSRVLVPNGMLRASINLGNPVLAKQDDPSSKPYGVSVDVADALANSLGVDIEYVVTESAGRSVGIVANDEADIGFFAIDPLRSEQIAFVEPYLQIEGWYVVRAGSPIKKIEQVDRRGVRVAVGAGSAYDLFLTREFKHAEIVRAPTTQAVTPMFIQQELEVAANVRQQLDIDMENHPGLRLLPERFMVIRQAVGIPRSRGEAATVLLSAFLNELKVSGFIDQALLRHGIQGASVVPLSRYAVQ